MSSVILKLLAKSYENKPMNKDANQINLLFNSIKKSFTNLAEHSYIERLPELDTDHNMSNGNKSDDQTKHKIPRFSCNTINKFDIPPINIEGYSFFLLAIKDA